MTDAGCVTLYPRYCFHLSPTVNTWCLLRASDIHGLDQHEGFEGEKFYFYKNLPIKWVRVVGVVVGIDDLSWRRFYFIDDSSGATIQAIAAFSTPVAGAGTKIETEQGSGGLQGEAPGQDPGPYPEVDVGCVVDIKGCVSRFREQFQISVEKMAIVKGTAQELALWEKRAKFRRDVLDTPWVLRDKDVRRCRKEAERSGGEAPADRKRGHRSKEQRREEGRRQRADKGVRSQWAGPRAEVAVDGAGEKRQRGSTGEYSALGL